MDVLKRIKNFFGLERAYSTYSIQAMFEERLEDVYYSTGEYSYVINHFVGDGEQYLVFVREGKYYRTDVSISGTEVAFSEPYEVVVEYQAISRENVETKLYRDKDNKLKFVSVASYATINRNGNEIDTKDLFDSFEETFGLYIEEPVFNLGHVHHEKFSIGIVRGVFRFENSLIAFGEIDETTPLGAKTEERIKSGEWGLSIEFFPLEREIERIANKDIIKYTKGYFAGLALLKEENAASYFTKIEVNRNMGKDAEKARKVLAEFLGSDKEAAEFMEDTELREKDLKSRGLIVRDENKNEQVENQEVDFELNIDEELIREITEKVSEKLANTLSAINDKLAALSESFERAAKDNIELRSKLDKLQIEDKQKIEDVVDQLPANRAANKINIVRKTNQATNAGTKLTLEQIAEDPASVRSERLSRLKQSKNTSVINKVE